MAAGTEVISVNPLQLVQQLQGIEMSVCETLPLRVPLPETAAHSPSTCSPNGGIAHQLLSQINYVVSALKEGRQNKPTFCLCRHAGRFQSYVVPSAVLALSSI